MSSKFQYDDDAMKRRLVKGDIGEAYFRLWFETNIGELKNTKLIHQGYNPQGIVRDEKKRKLLKQNSDPDFAIVHKKNKKIPLLGISVNLQKKPYTCHSTMGGFCIKCPRAKRCFDNKEENLWYNAFNIDADYVKFSDKHKVNVILVSLFNSAVDSMSKWISENNYDVLLHDYVDSGQEKAMKHEGWDEFYKKLISRTRVKDVKWLLHSDVLNKKVPSFITGGWSNFGRPREVFCIDIKLAKTQDNFISYIHKLDSKNVNVPKNL